MAFRTKILTEVAPMTKNDWVKLQFRRAGKTQKSPNVWQLPPVSDHKLDSLRYTVDMLHYKPYSNRRRIRFNMKTLFASFLFVIGWIFQAIAKVLDAVFSFVCENAGILLLITILVGFLGVSTWLVIDENMRTVTPFEEIQLPDNEMVAMERVKRYCAKSTPSPDLETCKIWIDKFVTLRVENEQEAFLSLEEAP